jgi:arylsulfatase A-like enzyme
VASDPTTRAAERPAGLLTTLRAGLNAGALCGLLFGLADGVVAALRVSAPIGFPRRLGCVAAATVPYGALFMATLAAAGLVLHPLLCRHDLRGRHTRLLATGLGLGLFLELYWWTRPYVFAGRSSVSPERLAVAAGLLVVGIVLGRLAVRLLARLPGPARAALPVLLTLCWLGGGAFLLAQRAPTPRGALNERNRDLPNVLLVVVDALRRDVIGAYGNERVHTPVIDRLAERGVLFEDAFVQAPFTWTSFGCLFTGKYPRRHGLVKMEAGVRMRPNVTLPWHLKSARFKAGGGTLQDGDFYGATFMTGALSNGSGLMRGFDVYFEAMSGHELVERDSAWSVFRSELLLWRVKNKLTQRFDPSLVVTTARRWLRANAGRRFVAMVHLYSTHTPYDPEPEFRRLYCDPAYDGPVKAFYAHHREAIERGEVAPTPADVAQIRHLYEAGVTQADRDIGLVVDELERLGELDDTLVIVTGDHGESLGEGNLWEHNHMVQTNLRVPLVMCWPKGLPRGRRVAGIVEEIDVFPTICDLFGLELPEPPAGADADEAARAEVDGVSLLPLVRGEPGAGKAYTYAENGPYVAVQDARWKLIVPRPALAEGGWEKVLSGALERPRLYDLERDPDETENLFAPDHPELARLLETLRAWDASMPIPLLDVVLSDRDLEEQRRLLIDLGYAGGVGQGVEARSAGEGEEPR